MCWWKLVATTGYIKTCKHCLHVTQACMHMLNILLCSVKFTIQYTNLWAHLVGVKGHQELLKCLKSQPEPLWIFHVKIVTTSKLQLFKSYLVKKLRDCGSFGFGFPSFFSDNLQLLQGVTVHLGQKPCQQGNRSSAQKLSTDQYMRKQYTFFSGKYLEPWTDFFWKKKFVIIQIAHNKFGL